LLWQICHHGVHGLPQFGEAPAPPLRHRDLLLQLTGAGTAYVTLPGDGRFALARGLFKTITRLL